MMRLFFALHDDPVTKQTMTALLAYSSRQACYICIGNAWLIQTHFFLPRSHFLKTSKGRSDKWHFTPMVTWRRRHTGDDCAQLERVILFLLAEIR